MIQTPMLTYPDAITYWRDLARRLLEQPPQQSRAGTTREIVGWSATIEDPIGGSWAGDPRRASRGYAAAELLWYLRGERTIEMLGAYAPSYAQFCEPEPMENGRLVARGAYGWRWFNTNKLPSGTSNAVHVALQVLEKDPNDRRAFVSMWDPGDVIEALRGVWRDIPCTIGIQFLVRGGRLHAVATMRSNDLWLGGVYDVWTFCQLQRLAAAYLGVGVGRYTHNVGSMHVYERDIPKLFETLDFGPPVTSPPWDVPAPTKEEARLLIDDWAAAPLVDAERFIRRERHIEAAATRLAAIEALPSWSAALLLAMDAHLTRTGYAGSEEAGGLRGAP